MSPMRRITCGTALVSGRPDRGRDPGIGGGRRRDASGEAPDPLPERLEVLINQGHAPDAAAVAGDLHGAKEPFPAFIQPAELGGVACEVVRDQFLVRKPIRRRTQRRPRLLETASGRPAHRVGAVQPGMAKLRGARDHFLRHLEGSIPFAALRVQPPSELEGDGMPAGVRRETFPLDHRLVQVAEFEPAFHGGEVVTIRGLERLHPGRGRRIGAPLGIYALVHCLFQPQNPRRGTPH